MFFDNDQNPNQSDLNNNSEKSDSCNSELEQLKDSFLRLNADFENYKKRTAKEKINWITNSQADLITDLLPIIDDFDRAFANYKKGENKDLDSYIQGFELIHKAFYKFLDKYDVKEITDVTAFNPEIHEAIAQVDSPNHKSGEIVAIVQKGFTIKDRILRPAKVTVAK